MAVQKLTEHKTRLQKNKDTIEISETVEVVCDRCGSKKCKRREIRNKKQGDVSIMYQCLEKECGKKFVHAPGFKGKHHSADTITDALFQVASGMSPESVSQWLAKNGKSVTSGTIRRWMKQYSELLKKFTDNIVTPRVGGDWSADELHFLSLGESAWVFGVMDTKSRAIVNYEQSSTKMGYDATELFSNAIKLSQKIPDIITTDKLNGFATGHKNAIEKNDHTNRSVHRKDAGISKVHINNNIYERFNGTLKKILKGARGFRSKSPALLVLFMAHYNLFTVDENVPQRIG